MKHTNDVITPKSHTYATVVSITMVKTFMIKAYIYKINDVRHRLSLISLFSLSFPRYHPWFSSGFCDARRSSSSVALPSFYFASCIEFHQFYFSHRHSPDTTFVFFKFLRYKNKHIISNTVIIRLRFLYTLVLFN